MNGRKGWNPRSQDYDSKERDSSIAIKPILGPATKRSYPRNPRVRLRGYIGISKTITKIK